MSTQDEKRVEARLIRQLQPSLSVLETCVCMAGWIVPVIYSQYHVHLASFDFKGYLASTSNDLEQGFFGYKRDVSDLEWHIFSSLILTSLPFLLIHNIGSYFLRSLNNTRLLPLFYASLGLIFAYKIVGLNSALFLCLQPILFFLALRVFRSSYVFYGLSLGLIFLMDIQMSPLKALHNWIIDETDYRTSYLTSVTSSWINARCLSFALDHLWSEDNEKKTTYGVSCFVKLLSYNFYLPVVFTGPIINYQDFCSTFDSPSRTTTFWSSLRDFWLQISRFLLWYAVNEAVTHATFFSAMQYNLGLMQRLDLLTFCGIGYAMGQFFYMKYLVFYGFPRPFMVIDGIQDPPRPPKCVSRIHLYTDMWRYFDNGLYRFIFKYFYSPLLSGGSGQLSKLLASFLTFGFVFVWHGLHLHVAIWSALNFLGVTLETAGQALSRNEHCQHIEKCLLGPMGRRRLRALLGAPLFMMSILSNIFFFTGAELGAMFVMRTCTAPVGTLLILLVMYCGAQTSYEVRNWEIKQQLLRMQQEERDL